MAVECPPEVLGVAVGVLVYSVVCLLSSIGMFYLVWYQHERTSYVVFLAATTSLATAASIAQQIHTIVSWRDIRMGQYRVQTQNPSNPELSISGSSQGLDLILFYIQFYCYNVEAILFLSWAFELTLSIFNMRWDKLKAGRGSMVAKVVAFILPGIQAGLLRAPAIQANKILFHVIASIIMALSLSLGALLLAIILLKYVHTRNSAQSWRVGYAEFSHSTSTQDDYQKLELELPRSSIYDKWLVVRFSIAFIALGAFELATILFQASWAGRVATGSGSASADLSLESARLDFFLFLPGVSAGLLLFFMFGTTKVSRDFLWSRVAPRRLRERRRARAAARLPSMVTPSRRLSALRLAGHDEAVTADVELRQCAGVYPRLPPISPADDMSVLSSDLDRIYMRGKGGAVHPGHH